MIIIALLFTFVNPSFAEDQNREVLPDLSPESVPALNDIINSVWSSINNNNAAGGLVRLDSSNKLPAVDGSSLTNVAAATAVTAVTATDATELTTASGSAPSYSCRAWVNFNGTGTPAIIASGNVASITDNGTGDYTVVFTTAMEDTKYAVVAMTDYVAASNFHLVAVRPAGRATGSCQILVVNTSSGAEDSSDVNVAFFR